MYTAAHFLWAYSAYTTRSLPHRLAQGLADAGPLMSDGLVSVPPNMGLFVPLLDLCNHNPDARVTWSCDQGRISLSQEAAVSAGEEFFNNYGLKSNEELLMGYGFALPDNRHDTAVLRLRGCPPQRQVPCWNPRSSFL